MEKALHQETDFYEKHGTVGVWDISIEEIVDAINTVSLDKGHNEPVNDVITYMKYWLMRYLNDGHTEKLLNDLNDKLKNIHYSRMVAPSDYRNALLGQPKNIYMARMESVKTPEEYAANDFCKLLTNGELKNLKCCSMDDCNKLFVGRPQAKWCSKSCGAKHRVRKKRQRDKQ